MDTPRESSSSALLGRAADDALLRQDPASLPADIGVPPASAPGGAHEGLVRVGAGLTGVTLIGGLAIAVFGLVELIGGHGALGLVALVIGVLLVATHWGWVHVAQFTADARDRATTADVDAARGAWLATVAPYTRYEVSSHVAPDASIVLQRIRHRPVAAGPQTFAFERDVQRSETHAGDAPAAEISERAEALRREAALDTDAERARFEEAASEAQTAALGASDDAERLAAQTAASRALSEQLNAHARRPPLIE